MHRHLSFSSVLALALCLATHASADSDPPVSQVAEARKSGNLEIAQQLVAEVLREQPRSARAHYMNAELYAAEGNPAMGQRELDTAYDLEPSLPFATAESVRALQGKLAREAYMPAASGRVRSGPRFPWGLLVVGVVVALATVLRLIPARKEQRSGRLPPHSGD